MPLHLIHKSSTDESDITHALPKIAGLGMELPQHEQLPSTNDVHTLELMAPRPFFALDLAFILPNIVPYDLDTGQKGNRSFRGSAFFLALIRPSQKAIKVFPLLRPREELKLNVDKF